MRSDSFFYCFYEFMKQVSLATFATFVLISPTNILDPNKAFVTLSLVNIMNFTLSILPLGVTFLGQVRRRNIFSSKIFFFSL